MRYELFDASAGVDALISPWLLQERIPGCEAAGDGCLGCLWDSPAVVLFFQSPERCSKSLPSHSRAGKIPKAGIGW